MNGMIIFGNAATSGVLRAADIESAAIARCTTRKSVHQYPNDSTNPSPNVISNQFTPIGLSDELAMCCQELVYVPGAKCALTATVSSPADSPLHPPTFFRPRYTIGANPSTIRKN